MSALILTVTLDSDLQAALDELRRTYFPALRNFVPAHVTLFHNLPGQELAAVTATLQELATATKSFAVSLPTLTRLSNGLALNVEAPPLLALHAALAQRFAAWLTPQDRQAYKPHVTIMNKTTPQIALATYNQLATRWVGRAGMAVGLDLWHYRGGPWEKERGLPFAPSA